MLNFLHWIGRRPFGLSWSAYRCVLSTFDRAFYLETQPDVAASGCDPLLHYLVSGWREARNPSSTFDTVWYLHHHPEAGEGGRSPLLHYAQFGHAAGFAPAPGLEDGDWREHAEHNSALPVHLRQYLSDYNLLAKSDYFDADHVRRVCGIGRADPVAFFLRFGQSRNLDPSDRFSSSTYLKLYRDVSQAGIVPIIHYLRRGMAEGRSPTPQPSSAVENYFSLSAQQVDDLSTRIEALGDAAPLISVVVPTYNTEPALLSACIRSILSGPYERMELILVDDASPEQEVRDNLRRFADSDQRIKLVFREKNGNISAATNEGLTHAAGSFVALVDHDDEVTPDAFVCVAEQIVAHPETDVWYTDQVKCDAFGEVFEHFFKPDWSPIYALGVMYVGHLLVFRASLLPAVGNFDSRFDGVQDYEFMLRLSENTRAIGHIPRALYKWRAIQGSLAAGVAEKSGIEERQRQAVESHLRRLGRTWVPKSHPSLPHRLMIEPGPQTVTPSVSIIIPSKDQGLIVERCLDSLFGLTDYPSFEVVVIDNGTTDPIALAAFERHPVRLIAYNKPFNFSEACNIGVEHSGGEFLIFLNNDTEVIEADWLRKIALYFEDDSIGAVGPTLLYPDRSVQHAGVVLGARGTADHVMRFFPDGVDGYAGSLACAREVSAVTAACLMMPRSLFMQIGRFCLDYAKHYQDVDLCLKIRELGKTIISAGNVKLIHHESLSRKTEGYDFFDRAILIDRWYETIERGDPYFNKHFNLTKLDYSLGLDAFGLV